MSLTTFLFGIGVGMALYRFIIVLTLQTWPTTICDYCQQGKKRMLK